MEPGAKPKEIVTGIVSRGTSLKGTHRFSPTQHIPEIARHDGRRSVVSYTTAPDELHERRARTMQEEPVDVSITDIKDVMCPRCQGKMQFKNVLTKGLIYGLQRLPVVRGNPTPSSLEGDSQERSVEDEVTACVFLSPCEYVAPEEPTCQVFAQ